MAGVADTVNLRLVEVITRSSRYLEKAAELNSESGMVTREPEHIYRYEAVVKGVYPGGQVTFLVTPQEDKVESYIVIPEKVLSDSGRIDLPGRIESFDADAAPADIKKIFPKVVETARKGLLNAVQKFGSMKQVKSSGNAQEFFVAKERDGFWEHAGLVCKENWKGHYLEFTYESDSSCNDEPGSHCSIDLRGRTGWRGWFGLKGWTEPTLPLKKSIQEACDLERKNFPSFVKANP